MFGIAATAAVKVRAEHCGAALADGREDALRRATGRTAGHFCVRQPGLAEDVRHAGTVIGHAQRSE